MGTQTFRVYNEARSSTLCTKVSAVDSTVKHLKTLTEFVAVTSGSGLWLNPYRDIPATPESPKFDLVFLDADNRVIREIESYPNPAIAPISIAPIKFLVASALVLPANTILASRTEPGDLLIISRPRELEEPPESPALQTVVSPAQHVGQASELEAPPESPALRTAADPERHARQVEKLEAPPESPTLLTAVDPEQHAGQAPAGPLLGEGAFDTPAGRSARMQSALQQLREMAPVPRFQPKRPPLNCSLRRLDYGDDPSDRRRATRHPLPGMVAYLQSQPNRSLLNRFVGRLDYGDAPSDRRKATRHPRSGLAVQLQHQPNRSLLNRFVGQLKYGNDFSDRRKAAWNTLLRLVDHLRTGTVSLYQSMRSLMNRFLLWLNYGNDFSRDPSDRRRATRNPLPGLVGYFWTGATPQAFRVADISYTGVYLLTEERPVIDTVFLLTLQRAISDGNAPEDSVVVQARVARLGTDGLGLVFVMQRLADGSLGAFPGQSWNTEALKDFLQRLNQPEKQFERSIGA